MQIDNPPLILIASVDLLPVTTKAAFSMQLPSLTGWMQRKSRLKAASRMRGEMSRSRSWSAHRPASWRVKSGVSDGDTLRKRTRWSPLGSFSMMSTGLSLYGPASQIWPRKSLWRVRAVSSETGSAAPRSWMSRSASR